MKHLKQPIARRANLEDDCTGHFFEQRFYSGALLTEEALVAAMAYVDLNPVRAELAERIEEIRDTSICERLLENSAEALEDYLRPVLSGLDRPPADEPPGVVAVAEPSAAASATPPVPRQAASGRGPDGDVGGPERPCGAETGGAGAETAGTSPENGAGPGNRRRRRPRLPRPHVTLAQYIELVRALAGTEHAPSGDAPDGVRRWLARTKALRKRQRAYGSEGRAAALDRRPGHAAPGDPPARLTPGGRRGPLTLARTFPDRRPTRTHAHTSWTGHPGPAAAGARMGMAGPSVALGGSRLPAACRFRSEWGRCPTAAWDRNRVCPGIRGS